MNCSEKWPPWRQRNERSRPVAAAVSCQQQQEQQEQAEGLPSPRSCATARHQPRGRRRPRACWCEPRAPPPLPAALNWLACCPDPALPAVCSPQSRRSLPAWPRRSTDIWGGSGPACWSPSWRRLLIPCSCGFWPRKTIAEAEGGGKQGRRHARANQHSQSGNSSTKRVRGVESRGHG